MAAVRAFKIKGLKLWFWSNDHTPPHFHAKRDGEWEVRVKFMMSQEDMIEIKWADKPPSQRALRRIRDLAEMHRVELLEQWEEINGS